MISLLVSLMVLSAVAGSTSDAYLAKPGVAVFEPKDYNLLEHVPSPIFDGPLLRWADIPADWKIVPHFSKNGKKSVVTISIDGADLYGGGEVLSDLRRNSDKQYFWNTDNPACMVKHGKQMYQSHPWVLGIRKDGSAFGIIADNTWKSSMSLQGKIRFESEGPAFRVIIIDKENPELVLRTLANLSGKMELPPLWALGYQQCRYSYFPQSRVIEIADELRSRKIPCDVIWMDIHYMNEFRIFTFSKTDFPDPVGLNEELHAKKFKAVYMIDPGVKAEKGYFVDDQLCNGDYAVKNEHGTPFVGRVWPGDCHFPDFTRPEVRSWWSGLYSEFMATGIDGIWNDMNEPSVFVSVGGTMPETNLHLGGDGMSAGTHLRFHNEYGYFMVKASREGILAAKPDKRPFVLSRSNFLGGQRYAATWTGDNFSDYSQMKASIPMTLNMGLSSQIFTGPDMGGFMKDCTADLLKHWTACGVYFPFVRNHSSLGTRDQEPFAFDEETENVCRTAINRRYRLLPYIYTLFEEASSTGIPVMRPLFWSDFKDNDLRKEQQAFLLGSDLLIIPKWSEDPVLPKGDWDLFSMEAEDDGYQAYLALRPGAALPITNVVQSTVDYNTDSLTILINPDINGSAHGTLYEDAGDGFGYKNGEFARYEMKASTKKGRLTLTIFKTGGNLEKTGRTIRIGQVVDGLTVFSDWAQSDSVSMNIVIDRQNGIEKKDLEFTPVKDFSVNKPITKFGLVMDAIFKPKKAKKDNSIVQ